MARLVPAVEVPKACRVKELEQGSVHHSNSARERNTVKEGEFECLLNRQRCSLYKTCNQSN